MRSLQLVVVAVVAFSLMQTGVSQCDVLRVVGAMYETLSPLLTEMKQDLATEMREGLAALRENLTNIQQQINALTETVSNLEQTLQQNNDEQTPKLDMVKSLLISVNTSMSEGLSAVNTSMSEGLSGVKANLLEHSSQTASELAGLETNQETIDSKLDSLDSKQDGLSMTVTTAHSELERNVLTNVTKELKKTADYILELAHTYECGGTGGWRRVVYLNMTDPNTNCPSGWQLTSHSKRTCGRVNTSILSCDSVLFPVSGGDYTSVCGSIRAYQYGRTDAFEAYHRGHVTTIEGAYVSGVSLTHGNPRQHIWTFAAGFSETTPSRDDVCPCDASINITVPPFVAGDYFCESEIHYPGTPTNSFYPDDPLWDGEGCGSSSSCCSFNNPPYFTKTLPSPTSDPIEARLCWLDIHGSPIEFIELYVK
ncbi:hypothetical protein GBAR_LOCUS16823 [Geodia barretti]|uniref:Uncharacterized protein n=1 Tax=Geodia barretti TaxID=519541 RepID=A0AA35WQ32_GEOBA|nr:hypothetical protein GBAR_LOCUS16823 [Geodia barretti]